MSIHNGKPRSAWMKRHLKDPYVQQAFKKGYRSRATFKLLQLHEKDKLFKPGQAVVDLGAAPGGWSQVLAPQVGSKGVVIALDRLAFSPIPHVHCLQGDFLEEAVQAQIRALCPQGGLDWVLSDMSPNLSGLSAVDQPRMIGLAEAVLEFAESLLKPGGGVLIKIFQGAGFREYYQALQKRFERVQTRKPEASRSESSEIYLLARGFKV